MLSGAGRPAILGTTDAADGEYVGDRAADLDYPLNDEPGVGHRVQQVAHRKMGRANLVADSAG